MAPVFSPLIFLLFFRSWLYDLRHVATYQTPTVQMISTWKVRSHLMEHMYLDKDVASSSSHSPMSSSGPTGRKCSAFLRGYLCLWEEENSFQAKCDKMNEWMHESLTDMLDFAFEGRRPSPKCMPRTSRRSNCEQRSSFTWWKSQSWILCPLCMISWWQHKQDNLNRFRESRCEW